MAENSNDSAVIRRAIVQKLESLHRSGVRCLPRTEPPSALGKEEATQGNPKATNLAASTAPGATGAANVAPTSSAASKATPTSTDNTATAGLPASKTKPPGPSAPITEPFTEPFTAPELPAAERGAALEVLSNEVAQCTRCQDLAHSRTQTVFGVGNPAARLVFFGEAPGADEDRMGEPFVGKAGQLLTKIIEACTLSRDDVYIMNVLRCRPPGNRNPTPEEAMNCRPFFEKQFEVVRPEFVCCLGSIAASTLLNTTQSVGRLRGKLHDWRGMKVMVTYHPAYLLRNASAKKHVWNDMKMLMKEMGIDL